MNWKKHISSFREFMKDEELFDGEYTVTPDETGPSWISEQTQGAWIAWIYMHNKPEDQPRNTRENILEVLNKSTQDIGLRESFSGIPEWDYEKVADAIADIVRTDGKAD